MVTEIDLFRSPRLNPFTSLDEERSLQNKGGIHETNCYFEFWMLLPALGNTKINSDEQRAIFAQELQNSLSLAVEFSNVYCELQKICHS